MTRQSWHHSGGKKSPGCVGLCEGARCGAMKSPRLHVKVRVGLFVCCGFLVGGRRGRRSEGCRFRRAQGRHKDREKSDGKDEKAYDRNVSSGCTSRWYGKTASESCDDRTFRPAYENRLTAFLLQPRKATRPCAFHQRSAKCYSKCRRELQLIHTSTRFCHACTWRSRSIALNGHPHGRERKGEGKGNDALYLSFLLEEITRVYACVYVCATER